MRGLDRFRRPRPRRRPARRGTGPWRRRRCRNCVARRARPPRWKARSPAAALPPARGGSGSLRRNRSRIGVPASGVLRHGVWLQYLGDRLHQAVPAGGLDRELPPPGGRKRIEARAPPVLGGSPRALDPPPTLEALQSGIERSMIDQQRVPRPPLDRRRDAMPMVRAERQDAKDEQVERPLQERASGGSEV